MLGFGWFPAIANYAGLVMAGLGLVFAGYFLCQYLKQQSIKSTLLLSSFALFFGTWIAGIIYAYHLPFFIDRLSLGLATLDTIYMADLATMFELHGIPSSGLNGFPFAHYHFGTNICFALLSRLLNISSLQFYLISYAIFIIPLFFNAFLTCVATWMTEKIESFLSNKLNIAFFALIFATGFIGLFPQIIQKSYALDWGSLLRSETYLFSLILVFTLLPITTTMFSGIEKSDFSVNQPKKFFAILALPVIIAAITVCKISTGFLLCGAVFYSFFRLKLYRKAWATISLLLITLVTYKAYSLIRFYSDTPIYPFHFLRTHIKAAFVPLFFIFYYAWLWLYAGLFYYRMKMTNVSFIEMWKKRETLPLELVVFIAVIGFIPGNVMAIAGGSAAYFMEPFRWLTLALILVNVPVFTQAFTGFIQRKGLSWQKITNISIVALMLFSLAENWHWEAYKRLRYVEKNKVQVQKSGHSKVTELINAMLQVGKQPADFRRHTALYIPRSNRLFWGLFNDCRTNPLVAPTLTRTAMINGLPSPSCNLLSETVIAYGYPEYPRSEYFKGDESYTEMCTHAVQKGFDQVLILGAKDAELVKVRYKNNRRPIVTQSKGQLYQQLVRCSPIH